MMRGCDDDAKRNKQQKARSTTRVKVERLATVKQIPTKPVNNSPLFRRMASESLAPVVLLLRALPRLLVLLSVIDYGISR
jgi:hypothetical protein